MVKKEKTCQQCGNRFEIFPEDQAFYQKITVPPPTFCPECRQKRRMTHYINVLSKRIYKRRCDATGKEIFTMYPPGSVFPVYDRLYWYSSAWDAIQFRRDYDFSKPFFQQLHALRKQVPRYSTWNINSENCDYSVISKNSKNCYLSGGQENLNCYYTLAYKCKDCFDCWFTMECELCYEGFFSEKCYRSHFAYYSKKCSDSWFLFDCLNCSNCFGCSNLQNKQYHIFNKPYSKAVYEKTIQQWIGDFEALNRFQRQWQEFRLKQPHRYANIFNSEYTTGNDASYSKNCRSCFEISQAENNAYITVGGLNLTDSYDCYDVGTNSSLLYEDVAVGESTSRTLFSIWIFNSHDVYYSDLCHNVANVFGCVGLRHKQYCVLNKQYTKAEYERLVPKIREHMDAMPYRDRKGREYRFGEAIPSELSLFAYNDSVAQEYFPLTGTEAEDNGYAWRVDESKSDQVTLPAHQLPTRIQDVPDSIVNEAIGCTHAGQCNEGCLQVFRLVPQELKFYREQLLPVPRLCPQCRHFQRARLKNPLRLWPRQCQCAGRKTDNGVYANTATHDHGAAHCPRQFQTTFSSDRPEIVYCDLCYQAETA